MQHYKQISILHTQRPTFSLVPNPIPQLVNISACSIENLGIGCPQTKYREPPPPTKKFAGGGGAENLTHETCTGHEATYLSRLFSKTTSGHLVQTGGLKRPGDFHHTVQQVNLILAELFFYEKLTKFYLIGYFHPLTLLTHLGIRNEVFVTRILLVVQNISFPEQAMDY